MKTLYLDLVSGISGDMFLGALIDLGVDVVKLERELKKLELDGYHLHLAREQKSGVAGVKLDVHLEEGRRAEGEGRANDRVHRHCHGHDLNRNFAGIKKLITGSKLSPWVRKTAVAVFQRIADAEGKIHGLPPERVHFHEVGATDSIVDIVGACIALEMLGKPRVLASPVVEGVGWIDCAHGRFPVPAPATLAILGSRGIGVTQCEEPHELVTPTGAALLAEFVESFGPMLGLVASKTGFGLGTRENQTRPNV
ncbi:MAG: LarC family nickel insertion protein, partial [Verrucomicrobiia bacterium]